MDFTRFFKIDIQSPDGQTTYRNYDLEETIDGVSTLYTADFGITESSMTLDEMLCENGIEFGAYNSNKFEIEVFDFGHDVAGYTIKVVDTGVEENVEGEPLFVGIIDSSTLDADSGYRKIIAYDQMYSVRDIDIGASWNQFWEETYEKIHDPDFNYDFVPSADKAQGWVKSGSVEIIDETGEDTISGRVLHFYGLANIQTTISLKPGETYTMSLLHKGVASGLSNPVSITYDTGTSSSFSVADNDEVYTQHDYTFTVPSDATGSATVKISQNSNNTTDQYFDRVTIHGNPYTLKEVRTALCEEVGLTIANPEQVLPNDEKLFTYINYLEGQYLAPQIDSVTFSAMLSSICQLQMCVPNMDRTGKIEFIELPDENDIIDLTPKYDLFGSEYLVDPEFENIAPGIGFMDGWILQVGTATGEDGIATLNSTSNYTRIRTAFDPRVEAKHIEYNEPYTFAFWYKGDPVRFEIRIETVSQAVIIPIVDLTLPATQDWTYYQSTVEFEPETYRYIYFGFRNEKNKVSQVKAPTFKRTGILMDKFEIGNTSFEDYVINAATGFSIYAMSSSVPQETLIVDGANSNQIPISGNLFLASAIPDQISVLMDCANTSTAPMKKVNSIRYKPAEIKMVVSDYNVKLGRRLITSTETDAPVHYVLSQTLSGPQLVEQTIKSPAYGIDFNSNPDKENDELVQNLKNKEYNSSLQNLESTVNYLVSNRVTPESVQIEITKYLSDSIQSVTTTTGYTFDEEGLTISKTDAGVKTKITEDGLEILENSEGSETSVLSVTHNGVDAQNLHATTYLIIGDRCRFEDYGEDRTGCFPIN